MFHQVAIWLSFLTDLRLHLQPCGTGAVDGTYERSQNFKKVLETFFEGSLPEISPLGGLLSLETSPSSTGDGPTNPLFTSFSPEVLPPSSSSIAAPQPVVESVYIADLPQAPVTSADTQISHSDASPTHYCNEHTSLPSDSKSIDIVYQYEVVLSHSIDLQAALIEVKTEAMTNLADYLGCTAESMRRSLRNTVHNSTLIGLREGIDNRQG